MIEGYPAAIEIDKPREKCGVFGIYAPGLPVAEFTYEALQIQQHRGQEAAGIQVSYSEAKFNRIIGVGGQGKVHDVFNGGKALVGLSEGAALAVGQTRYGTAETPAHLLQAAIQPLHFMQEGYEEYEFTLSHNGNVESLNHTEAASDTREMLDRIADAYIENSDLTAALAEVLPTFDDGAFSLVLSSPDKLIAARDKHGFRPLHLGRLLDNKGWAVASEIAALDIIGAEPVREVRPGEILTIKGTREEDLTSTEFAEADLAFCGFEFVYFSRADNEACGEIVADVRERMGQLLAKGDDVKADMVIGVPDSGTYAADGYSWESGIPHKKNIIRNRHVDRSFTAPTQNERVQAVRNKLNPLKRRLKDQSVVIVDDSIVRGTTQKELIGMLREAGASEVHVRISSPPYKWPCYHGMDTGRKGELIAANKTVEEIRAFIGADSLKYLSNEDMSVALGSAVGKVCMACTTGEYVTEVPVDITHKIA